MGHGTWDMGEGGEVRRGEAWSRWCWWVLLVGVGVPYCTVQWVDSE